MKSPLKFLCVFTMASAHCFAADNAPVNVASFPSPVRLACVGDSITAGVGADKGKDYPAQLAAMLGSGWQVQNFGASGHTLLRKGNAPYANALKPVLDYAPNVVVIMLGTNDTKPVNWIHKDEFLTDYRWMVEQFQQLPNPPRIFVCHPCLVSGPRTDGINESGVLEEIPLIDKLADEMNLGVIDMHSALTSDPKAFLPDAVHPSTAGATRLAETVYQALTGNPAPNPAPVVAAPAPKPAAPKPSSVSTASGSLQPASYSYDGDGEGALPSKSPPFPDDELSKLTDGEIPATAEFQDPAWVGFLNKELSEEVTHPQVTFEFAERQSPRTVTITYFHSNGQASGTILAPKQVLISVSDDGSKFSEPVAFTPFDEGEGNDIRVATIQLDKSLSGKFFRLDFRNPSMWTFLGEITFE